MHKKIYVSSSGSFIGVRNLTIDNAPTNPKDKAKEDLTTVITIVVATPRIGNILANDSGLDIEWDFALYNLPRRNDRKNDNRIDTINESIGICTFSKLRLTRLLSNKIFIAVIVYSNIKDRYDF